MSTYWWLITSSAAFGYAVTVIPLLRPLGAREVTSISHAPTAALIAQALVLWGAGTSVTGVLLSFAAGAVAAAVVARIQWKEQP